MDFDNIKAVVGDESRAKLLWTFWESRGTKDERTLLVTSALMAGKQALSPMAAFTIASSLGDEQDAQVLQLGAYLMIVLKQFGEKTNANKGSSFASEISDSLSAIGERIQRFADHLEKHRKKNSEG